MEKRVCRIRHSTGAALSGGDGVCLAEYPEG